MIKGVSRITSAAACVLGLVAMTAVEAAPITPGSAIAVLPEADPVGGTVVGSLSSNFNTPFFSGTVVSEAISGDTSNTMGGLTFTYRITNSPNSSNAINRLTAIDFANFLTDVSFQSVGTTGNQVPTSADRGPVAGSVVGFNFVPPTLGAGQLLPGQTSALLVVQTNAPTFVRDSSVSIIDGSAISVSAIGPAVPEPTSLALIGLGVGALALRRRSK